MTTTRQHNELRSSENNSYYRMNLTESHANGWAVVILRKGEWVALDEVALYEDSSDVLGTVRAYFNADMSIKLNQIETPVSDNLDMFGDMGLDANWNTARTVDQVNNVSIYEFAIENVLLHRDIDEEETEQIKTLVATILKDVVKNSEYSHGVDFDVINLPATA